MKQLLTQPTLNVDLWEMSMKFKTGEYGIINNFISFDTAIQQIAQQFDTIGVWAAIDNDIEETMSTATLVDIDVGITDILRDLRTGPLGEFINRRVCGLDVTLVLGTLYFFQPIYYD